MGYPTMSVASDTNTIKVLVTGQTVSEHMNLKAVIAVHGNHVDFNSVLAATQTVTVGLDDMVSSGNNVGNNPTSLYEVVIAATGTPDDFKWRRLTNGAWTAFSADIAIIAGDQELEHGISISFAATTGHTADDAWQFIAKENTEMTNGDIYPWAEMFRVTVDFHDGKQFYFDTQQVTNQGGWVATLAGLEVAVNDIQGWIL
jgi:hypothetical protein